MVMAEMTLPQWLYRLYLHSPGWKLTRWLRKRNRCAMCWKLTRLELHHIRYDWHNRHLVLRWIVPNLWDEMKTLCDYHHRAEHQKGRQ